MEISGLNIEEKKAIEYWRYIRDTQIYNGYIGQRYSVALLNLIQKQEKVIDMLMPYVLNRDISEDYCDKVEDEYCNKVGIGHCYDCIKQYFYRKVNKENEI